MTEHAAEGTQALFRIGGLEVTGAITTMWIIMAVLALLSWLATRNTKRIPKGLQNFLEWAVESLENFYFGLLGKENARRFLPFLMTMFLFILLSNYSGLIPGFGHIPGLQAPTSQISVTAAFALVVFVAVHFIGIREHGLHYFKRYVQPFPFFLPLNIIEEFVRPLSLALRLYGNIYGEEMTIAVIVSLVPIAAPLPMMLLSVLMGFIQSLVFTLLTAVYIGNAVSSGH